MLSLRPITLATDGRISPADYELVSPWWQARGGDAPSREMLPTLGAVASHDGCPLACAFMYLDATGSGVAWLAWVATCPCSNKHRVGRALSNVVKFLVEHAKELNYWLITATYHHPSLVSLLKQVGFIKGDTGMTQLFKKIQ